MSEFSKYSSIDNLYKCPDWVTWGEIVATEKLHGCNFRIFIPKGFANGDTIKFGSRNNEVQIGSGFYADRPVKWFLNRQSLLNTLVDEALQFNGDVTIYGEIIGSTVQKGVSYTVDDNGDVTFRAFDVKVGERFLDYNDFVAFCVASNLPRVIELYRGSADVNKVNALLEIDSYEGLRNGVTKSPNITEGVVIKPLVEGKDFRGNRLIAKHKSDGFAEKSEGKRGALVPRYDNPCLAVAAMYVTRGRVLNCIEKLESDIIPRAVTDMSAMKYLPAFVYSDVCCELWDRAYETGETLPDNFDEKGLRSAVTKYVGVVLKGILNERIGT